VHELCSLAVRDDLAIEGDPHPPRGILEVQRVRLERPVLKLNVPALWLPKGPVPIVRVIVSLLSGRFAPTPLPSLAPSFAGSVYWSMLHSGT
jgi:hypothetical protein